jgi:hypothetical protein
MADNPVTYTLGIDAESTTRVVEWAAKQDDWTDDDDPFPAGLSEGDVTALGAVTARTREEAVQLLLESDAPAGPNQDRLVIVQAAAQDGVRLLVVVAATAYVAKLPVELERKLRIG